MRLLPFVAFASAFVVPDPQTLQELVVEDGHLDKLPAEGLISPIFEDAAGTQSPYVDEGQDEVDEWFWDGPEQYKIFEDIDDDDLLTDDFEIPISDEPGDKPHHPPHHKPPHHKPPHHGPPHHGPPHHGPPHHAPSNKTIYQLISENNQTTKFASLVDKYDDIVALLNSTTANYTLFVPIDAAFKHHPHLSGASSEPSKEFIESVLKYHIGVGFYPAGRLLATHTLPTALEESLLGGQPQRLRTSFGLTGMWVNFGSRIVRANFGAKNGVIHAVNHLLVPPPVTGRLLTLFPTHFSTLLLAYARTDFVSFVHGLAMNGSTLFAPSNAAFARLGAPANAFLFNTPLGKRYLLALLKYQLVANATVYSDAFYSNDAAEGGADAEGIERRHLDLPSLLDDKPVGIDVVRFGVFTRIIVNGHVPVIVKDGLSKNGVIQVVGRLLFPPRKHQGGDGDELGDGEMTVQELKERLAGYVDVEGDEEVVEGEEINNIEL